MRDARGRLASTDSARRPLPREAQLLLATAGGAEQDARIVELAGGPINWILLLQLIALERAEAIVASRFSRLSLRLPGEVARQLKAMALRSDLRMATLSHRLDRTLEVLTAADIPVLLLKGAALGRTVYGSLPRRPMLDIDVLVSADRASDVRTLAIRAGWVPTHLDDASEYYGGHFHLPPLADGLGFGFNLEIHTGLFVAGHPFAWPLEDLWARSRPLPHGAGRVPSPEDILLHTVLHFSWSHMARVGPWRTFRDVHTMAASGAVDWREFTRLALESGAAPAAYWTLRLAGIFGVTDVPAETVAALRPGRSESVCRILDRHFAGQWFQLEGSCPSLKLERFLWQVGMGPLGRVRGHSAPWGREALFPELHAQHTPETASGRLGRHLTRVGSYARYLRRVVLGKSPARSAKVARS